MYLRSSKESSRGRIFSHHHHDHGVKTSFKSGGLSLILGWSRQLDSERVSSIRLGEEILYTESELQWPQMKMNDVLLFGRNLFNSVHFFLEPLV